MYQKPVSIGLTPQIGPRRTGPPLTLYALPALINAFWALVVGMEVHRGFRWAELVLHVLITLGAIGLTMLNVNNKSVEWVTGLGLGIIGATGWAAIVVATRNWELAITFWVLVTGVATGGWQHLITVQFRDRVALETHFLEKEMDYLAKIGHAMPGQALPSGDTLFDALTAAGAPGSSINERRYETPGDMRSPWVALVTLPPKISPEELISHTHWLKLKSALALPPGWQLEYDLIQHSNQISLKAGPMRADAPTPGVHPLLDADRLFKVDPWGPVPLGTDVRGETVDVRMFGTAGILIAGIPGGGKSWVLQSAVAFVAIAGHRLWLVDPSVVELQPWAPLGERIATRPEEFAELLKELQGEIDRRLAHMAQFGVKGRKLGPEHGLEPLALVVDELESLVDIPNAKLKAEIADRLRDVLGRCRKTGIYVITATQNPSDKVIPSYITSKIANRLALCVGSEGQAVTILGQQAWQDQVATELKSMPPGTGYVFADGMGLRKVRGYPLPDEDLERVIEKVRARFPDRTGAVPVVTWVNADVARLADFVLKSKAKGVSLMQVQNAFGQDKTPEEIQEMVIALVGSGQFIERTKDGRGLRRLYHVDGQPLP